MTRVKEMAEDQCIPIWRHFTTTKTDKDKGIKESTGKKTHITKKDVKQPID